MFFLVENVAIGDRGRLNQKHQAARMEESSRRFGRPITKQVQSTVDPRWFCFRKEMVEEFGWITWVNPSIL